MSDNLEPVSKTERTMTFDVKWTLLFKLGFFAGLGYVAAQVLMYVVNLAVTYAAFTFMAH